jgi:DNA-binding NarL/FixJ family response regulator
VRGSDGSAVERPMPNPGGQPAAPDPMDTAEAPSRAGSRARRGTVTAREPGRPAGSAPSASSRGRERGGTHRGIRSPPGSIPQPGTAQPRHGRTGLAGAPAPIRPAGQRDRQMDPVGSPVTDRPTTAPGWAPVKNVLICDERPTAGHALTRTVTAALSRVDIDRVTDGADLLEAFTAKPADLVLIGIQHGRGSGTDAVNLLLGRHPSAAVIVFGAVADTVPLVAAIARGARGLMLWEPEQPTHPPAAPDTCTIPRPGQARQTRDGAGPPTKRELQVLRGMSQGRSNSQIGRDLLLSENTVKNHAHGLFRSLGARSRAHAVAVGLRNGLLA